MVGRMQQTDSQLVESRVRIRVTALISGIIFDHCLPRIRLKEDPSVLIFDVAMRDIRRRAVVCVSFVALAQVIRVHDGVTEGTDGQA